MPNDPVINSVAGMVMQIMHEARGMRDISGANVADYEQISPTTAASIRISNARSGVPFLSLINNLPRASQSGAGTPSLDNVRPLNQYTKSVIHNSDGLMPIEVNLPDGVYGGKVNYINREIVLDIVRVQLPSDGNWVKLQGSSFTKYYITEGGIIEYARGTNKVLIGENCTVGWGASSDLSENTVVLYQSQGYPGRVYYQAPESAGIASVDDFKTWLADNPIYIYVRAVNPITIPFDVPIPYVLLPEYTISAEIGTLTVKYSGIASEGTSGGLGAGLAPAPEQINEPETPAIVESIAEEITNQEDEEK